MIRSGAWVGTIQDRTGDNIEKQYESAEHIHVTHIVGKSNPHGIRTWGELYINMGNVLVYIDNHRSRDTSHPVMTGG
jgi:hypothetical protein